MSIPAYAPTPSPVNTRGLTNVLYIADYATAPGDFSLTTPSTILPGIGSIIRKPANTNGHTLVIEDNNIGAGTFTIDSVVITAANIGETILIKDHALGYGQAINVPELYIPPGNTPTAATPFPPNVPGLPSGFPTPNPLNAVAAPPAIANYDPIGNPTGGVWPYNYWQGHPFRDDTVVEINDATFGIYEIIDVQTFANPAIMDYVILTRTRESLGIVPGSIVYIKNGTINGSKQFIFESNDTNFALCFSGLRNGISYTQTGLNIILTGSNALTGIGSTLNGAGTLFLSQLKIGDTITIDPDPAPGGPFTVTSVISNTAITVTPAFTALVPAGAELRLTSGAQSVTGNYQLINASISNTQPGDPDDRITSNTDIFSFGGTIRDLNIGDKIYISNIGDPGAPTNVFTIAAILSPTIATLDADITSTVSVPSQQIYKFSSSTLLTGRFTTFAADFVDNKFVIGDTIQINTGVDQEDLIISGIISNTQLVVQTAPVGCENVCVPGNIVASSDIFINSFVADTPDPLIINNIEAVNAEICNLTIDSALCPMGMANINILSNAGPGTTTFTIDSGVTVNGISLALMTPLFTEKFCCNGMQALQITNWGDLAFDSAGNPVIPPGPAGVYTDGSAAGAPPPPPPYNPPPNPLEIFSQDPTNTISFMGTNVGAAPPYFVVPSNNLVDIATLTIDVGGTLTTTTLQGDGVSDLILSGNGFDIDLNGDVIKNTPKLLLTGATPCIDTDAAVTLTFGDTNATDFNFSDKNINIGGAVGSILTDNIAGSTGAIIDFTANNLTNITSLTATTVNTITVQNTAGSLLVQSTAGGGAVNVNTTSGQINLTALGGTGSINLTTGAADINLSAGGGSDVVMAGQNVDLTGSTIDFATSTWLNQPQEVVAVTFDGTGAVTVTSATPLNILSIVRNGAITGAYIVTTSGGLGLSDATHTVSVQAADTGFAAASYTPITASARITGISTIEVFVMDPTLGGPAYGIDVDSIHLCVWRT